MPNNLPKIQLNAATFNPATFTPQVYNPLQPDMNLLARSLDKIEDREEKLSSQRAAIAEAFSKARDLLPDNAETNQYITDNQNRVMNSIDAMADIDDVSGALTSARQLASEFISSPEYNARVKEHKQRAAWLEDLNRSNVDNYIKEYYKDTYQDRNNFTRDENGNVTGTAGWEAPLPEQGQSATAIIQMAVKATADERTDTSSSHSGSGGGSSSAYRRELLTADKISQTAKSIVNSDTRVRQAFIDQFNAGIHQINKLERQKNELSNQLAITTDENKRRDLETRIAAIDNQASGYKKSFYKNGAPMESADFYIDNMFSANNEEIKNASYDYQHSSSSSHSGSARGGGGNGNLTGLGGFNGLGPTSSSLEGGVDLSAPGQSTRAKSEKVDVPTRTLRPGQAKPENYVMKNSTIVPTPWSKK